MIKKMKCLLLTLLLFIGTLAISNAQDDDSYKMWESIMLTPDNKNLKVLSENMRTHNQKYRFGIWRKCPSGQEMPRAAYCELAGARRRLACRTYVDP